MPEFQPFGDDEFAPISGIGLDFDADGNLIGIIDQEPEPELPPLPGQEEYQIQGAQVTHARENEAPRLAPFEDENMLEFGEAALPDAAAFPPQKSVRKPALSETQTSESTETEQASARMTRTRRTKPQSMLDEIHRISREEFRSWSENYVNNMDASRKRHRTATQAQARKNALALLYYNGIADVGTYRGTGNFVHPLAFDFSGDPLKARLRGQDPEDLEPEVKKKRGRRRKSEEAFEGQESIDADNRQSRQRVDDEAELGRGEDGDEHLMFDDHTAPEIGMDAVPPMEDRHSSSMMPWSRPGSVIPGSSVRGSAQKARPAPSPLLGLGGALGSINRYSDPAEPLFGQDDFGSQDSSFQFGEPVGALDSGQAGNDTQLSTGGLDIASQDFLGYATHQAEKKGIERGRGPENQRWIEFEELADPNLHTKAIAAQAFLHVLSLATKNVISVEQDGAEKMRPFGTIRIGLDVGNNDDEQAESEDEIA